MTLADRDGLDGLTLCEAYRMSPPTEELRILVAKKLNIGPADADHWIRCGYVFVNGEIERRSRAVVQLGAAITIRPGQVGPEWDDFRIALECLLPTVSDDDIAEWQYKLWPHIEVAIRNAILTDQKRRGIA